MALDHSRPVRLSNWPVIVGLGVVTLLIATMIGFDVLFSERQAATTANIVEDVQRSMLLLNDIRTTTRQMADTTDSAELQRYRAVLAELSRAYGPLTTYAGEREAWMHLQRLLAELTEPAQSRRPTATIESDIDKSVRDLVSINNAEGNSNLTTIKTAHRQALLSDIAAGAVVLTVVALISAWLLRVLARQRRLVVEHVRVLNERNSELEAFAARAAHDLRSPLNPIRGYADLILEAKDLPDEVPAMAQRIRRAVDRMARVVDDMLALSASGRPPKGESSPAAVVDRLREEMGAELHDVTLTTNAGPGRVACADGVLEQILRNLIGNAIKFRSPTRPLHIRIEARDDGNMVELSVEDNGVGMDAEGIQHAFEPFYRGHQDRELPGHGLGLAIVDRTVRALGGLCEIQSDVDRRTRIAVRLPRA